MSHQASLANHQPGRDSARSNSSLIQWMRTPPQLSTPRAVNLSVPPTHPPGAAALISIPISSQIGQVFFSPWTRLNCTYSIIHARPSWVMSDDLTQTPQIITVCIFHPPFGFWRLNCTFSCMTLTFPECFCSVMSVRPGQVPRGQTPEMRTAFQFLPRCSKAFGSTHPVHLWFESLSAPRLEYIGSNSSLKVLQKFLSLNLVHLHTLVSTYDLSECAMLVAEENLCEH